MAKTTADRTATSNFFLLSFLYSHSFKRNLICFCKNGSFHLRNQDTSTRGACTSWLWYDLWEYGLRAPNTLYNFICNPTLKHIVVGAPVRAFLNDVRATIFYYNVSYLLDYYWCVRNVSVGANYHRNFFSLFINKTITFIIFDISKKDWFVSNITVYWKCRILSHDLKKIDFIDIIITFWTKSKYLVIVPPARYVGSGQ